MSDSRRVLVVDDDDEVRDLLTEALHHEGHDVETAADGATALYLLSPERSRSHPDLVLLDVGLPGMDGFEVLRRIRALTPMPVILVTAAGDEHDRVAGLDLGADDYVVKPFSIAELSARVRSVLRRVSTTSDTTADGRIERGDLVIDVAAQRVALAGVPIDLPHRELALLTFLAAAPGKAFSREELLQAVWGSSQRWQDPTTVTEHVRRVRLRIESDPAQPRWIETVRGVGYRFAVA